jgi:RHS repeat-associated protein
MDAHPEQVLGDISLERWHGYDSFPRITESSTLRRDCAALNYTRAPLARLKLHGRRTRPATSVRRYYDPATGQFISVDPAIDQTEQAYAYVNGDPVDATDPLGFGCGWTDPNPLDCAHAAAGAIESGGTALGSAISTSAEAWWQGAGDLGDEASTAWRDVEGGLCFLGHEAYQNAAAISAVTSALTIAFPVLAPVTGPASLIFGGMAAYQDRHRPVLLTLDVVSVGSGTGALALGSRAAGLERAASAAWRLGPVGDWLRLDAQSLRSRAQIVQFASMALSVLALRPGP